MTKSLKILVVGATGKQGGSVAKELLKKGHRVRALTRSIESPPAKDLAGLGAELYEGDLTEPESLAGAFEGVDGVFGVTTPFEIGTEGETRQGIHLVEAAKKAGVRHFVFSSVGCADQGTGIPHFESKYEVEKHLVASGVPYTIIGPVFFMENWLSPWFLPGLQEGNVAMAMPGNRPLAHIALEDIGKFAALIFERREHFLGRRIDIAGDTLTGKELATRLGSYTGRRLHYYEIPLEALRAQNPDFALMFEWFDKVGYAIDFAALEREYPEVEWTRFDRWMKRQDWSALHTPAAKAS